MAGVNKNSPAIPGAEELSFCAAWVQHRRDRFFKFIYAYAIPLHLAAVVIVQVQISPFYRAYRQELMLVHVSALVLLILGFLGRRWARVWYGAIITAIVVVLIGYQDLVYRTAAPPHISNQFWLASATFFAFSSAAMQFYPGRWLTGILLGLMLIGCTAWVAKDLTYGGLWTFIYSISMAFGCVCRAVLDFQWRRGARSEYRFRSQVAPIHILRHSAAVDTDIQALFRPEIKDCVCLSSDWRNYQELSSRMAPSQLATTLNEYYDLCQALLFRLLPSGNYFTDWIADELFVVIFALPEGSTETLVDSALRFATELLAAKSEFKRVHGLPTAVDIGVAAGEALIGMMGPAGHRKATALGSVPGRARRLEGTGKILRRARGDRDRIMFGRECLTRLTMQLPAVLWQLPPGEVIRDQPDREIYYIEAEAEAPQSLSA